MIKNASRLASGLKSLNYDIVSGGTDNHCILIDLRNKEINGKDAENALGLSNITVNKNMVPFDEKSPFVTSGIRFGTPAITTRGINKSDIDEIVELIDIVINNAGNEKVILSVKKRVNHLMKDRPLFVP